MSIIEIQMVRQMSQNINTERERERERRNEVIYSTVGMALIERKIK